jgi:hypothetical protein
MKRLWLAFPLSVVLSGLAISQAPQGLPGAPVTNDLEADLRKAKVGDKYSRLLTVLRVPDDRARYGTFRELGLRPGNEYAGQENLPRGYWVYVYPHWFIWGAVTPKRAFGPEQATGAPDSTRRGRAPTAWSPPVALPGGEGWLELGYEPPVQPIAILVYGSGLGKAVSRVSVPGKRENDWLVLWQRGGEGGPETDVLVLPAATRVNTRRVRIHVTAVDGGVSIDAVGLLDPNGLTHWATSATASVPVERPDDRAGVESAIAGGPFGGRGQGRRGLRRRYGGAGTAEAVELGLDWLARHQTEDGGFWDCDGFSARCSGRVCDGKGYPLYDPGVTGLAVLAFLGAGNTHTSGKYGPAIGAALKYLKRIQDKEGCFGPQTGHYMYNHAICTLAMAEAYGMTRSPLLRRPVEKALSFLYRAQNPSPSGQGKLGWRYTIQPGDNDTSVTGWVVMALKSAKAAGIEVPREVLDGARSWVDLMTDPTTGRVGYVQKGVSPVRAPGREETWPRSRSEAITAVGMLTRIFLGESPDESETIRKGAALCLERLPAWNETDGSIDHYYWYAGTLAMFQVGGRDWATWNRAMKHAIVDHQRKDGCARGSWDPLGPWGDDGGRVYATAVMTMCLEVYYRYGKVFRTI